MTTVGNETDMDVRTPRRRALRALVRPAVALTALAGVAVMAHYDLSAGTGDRAVYSGVQAANTTSGGGVASNSNNGNGNGNGGNGGGGNRTFTISGSLSDVYPGQGYPTGSTSSPLYVYLTVNNPNNQAIQVTSLTLSVGDASARCTRANLSPSSETVSFSVVVPKNSTVGGHTFPMPISMVPGAPDACQRATFPLTLSGVAVGPA